MAFILKGNPNLEGLVKKFYQGKPDSKPVGKTTLRLEQSHHKRFKLPAKTKELMVCQAFYNEDAGINPDRAMPGKEGVASFRRRQQATVRQVQKIMGFVPDPEED